MSGPRASGNRAKLISALGLAIDADDAVIEAALDDRLGNPKPVAPVSSAGDVQVVAAAVRDGRISASSSAAWLGELKRNPDGTRRVLAALPASSRVGTTSAQRGSPAAAVDAELAGVFAQITGHHIDMSRQPHPPRVTPRAAEARADASAHAGEGQSFALWAATDEQMNAQLAADPELHRAAWAVGIRDIAQPPAWNYRITES